MQVALFLGAAQAGGAIAPPMSHNASEGLKGPQSFVGFLEGKQELCMFSLFISVVLNMAGFALLLPSLVYSLKNLGATPALATLALAGYSTASFLAGPVLGRLSDTYGRRKILLASLMLSTFAYSLLALWGDQLWLVYVALVLAGVAAGNMSVLFAAVTDRTTIETRAKGMGMIGAGVGLAFTLGPFLGSFLGSADAASASLLLPGRVSAVAAATAALVILFMFRLPAPTARSQTIDRMKALRQMAHRPTVLATALVVLAFTAALSLMEPTLLLVLEDKLAWGPAEVGRLFGLIGLVLIIVQGGLIGRLVKRFGEVRLVEAGMVFMAVGLSIILLAGQRGSAALFAVGVVVAATGTALHQACINTIASLQAGAHERGQIMGGVQSMQALGRVLGPLFAGLAYQLWSGLPFAAGVLCVLGAAILFRARVKAALGPNAVPDAMSDAAVGPQGQAAQDSDVCENSSSSESDIRAAE